MYFFFKEYECKVKYVRTEKKMQKLLKKGLRFSRELHKADTTWKNFSFKKNLKNGKEGTGINRINTQKIGSQVSE